MSSPKKKMPTIDEVSRDHTNYNLRRTKKVDYKILDEAEDHDKDEEYEVERRQFRQAKTSEESSLKPQTISNKSIEEMHK